MNPTLGIKMKSKRRSLHSVCLMTTLSASSPKETLDITDDLEDNDYKIFLSLQTESGDADVDPLHKIFLEHLKEDGRSYIFEMKDGDHGLPAVVKYERENESSDETEFETQRRLENISVEERRDHTSESMWADGTSSPELVQVGAPYLGFENGSKMGCSWVDDNYQTFLQHVRFEGSSMILEWESRVVRYYEEVKGSSGSEGLATENTQYNGERGLIPYESSQYSDSPVHEDDSCFIMTIRFSDSCQYKRELLATLSKPYDQNEYEQLLKEATNRKLMNRQKHLRSMSISYATKVEGMSYLDHHPDLAEQIQSADCHRSLALLRGFFFWLKNLCHEGAFMPWLSLPSNSDTSPTSGYELALPIDATGDEI